MQKFTLVPFGGVGTYFSCLVYQPTNQPNYGDVSKLTPVINQSKWGNGNPLIHMHIKLLFSFLSLLKPNGSKKKSFLTTPPLTHTHMHTQTCKLSCTKLSIANFKTLTSCLRISAFFYFLFLSSKLFKS